MYEHTSKTNMEWNFVIFIFNAFTIFFGLFYILDSDEKIDKQVEENKLINLKSKTLGPWTCYLTVTFN